MAKHQSKPQLYKSDITPCGQIWNLPSTQTTKKQCQSEDRKVGEATDINKGFCLSGNISITCVISDL